MKTTLALIALTLLVIGTPDRLRGETNAASEGPFQGTEESLARYQCPEWFRDAKLGIWAVWGPESVPMQGDWYARNLYLPGHAQNRYHLEHYGHPSKVGFKDIIPLWKAEKWDPDRLMNLYRKAGAKYFCMIAMHHDNFDCWDSKDHRWNSVYMGPRRDIAGEWQQAAKKYGLRFGMTEHLAASWWFYSSAKGADTNGSLAGVAFDGADPKLADLYWSGNEKPTFKYYGTNVPASFKTAWFARIKGMIDRYHPDLVYSDSPLPYPEDVGRKLVAYFYNDNLRQHGGTLQAVYNCKEESHGRWVQDLERGVKDGIDPNPWQTDTCVGNWYYKTGTKYKSTSTVIHMLADIVSKNGNLLLNFPPRPDGTLDAEAEQILADLAAWMPVNGEAIFGTRPWKVFGEGPAQAVAAGNFNEGKLKYSAEDIRFTRSKDSTTVYAIVLGVPTQPIRIKSLTGEKIASIALLGSEAKVEWKQEPDAVVIPVAATWPTPFAVAFKVTLK
jgi:alpha-L-fucosidase